MKYIFKILWTLFKCIITFQILLLISSCLMIYVCIYLLWHFKIPNNNHFKELKSILDDFQMRYMFEVNPFELIYRKVLSTIIEYLHL